MPEITELVYVKNRSEWREWLMQNHDRKKEVWVLYYKVHTGKKRIPYDDAVEEALCYGWIDTTVKRIDEEKHAQRFTPRKKNSQWSELNLKRARKMIREGKMTHAGREALGDWLEKKQVKRAVNPRMPEDLRQALSRNKKAERNFKAFAPSYKRHFIWHILDAKQAATRQRRIAKVVSMAARNVKPGMG